MNDIALYLAKNKAFFKSVSCMEVSENLPIEAVTLAVVVLSSSKTEIIIGHLKQEFTVRHADVIGIRDAPESTFNYFASGRPALITLKRTATLIQRKLISVAVLEVGQPFAFASRTTASAT